jgi:membrane-bound inhibitor of C-type lysozyme
MLRAALMAALIGAGVLAGTVCAPAQAFSSYRCRDGTRFAVAFYAGVRLATLRLNGKTMTLSRRVSASGRRYWGHGIILRVRGRAATLTRGRASTECGRI